MRRRLIAALVTLLAAGGTALVAVPRPAAAATWTGLRAGAAVVDATWHVGASAGQYASNVGSSDIQGEWDPQVASVAKRSSYGVASRLSVSAIVLQDGKGDPPVALVRDDNYLAQDMLVRRVGQLLAADHSPVTYQHILLSASHDHNSPYYSTPSAGVWLFQDAMDLRMFEYQARRIAAAIEQATATMRPARAGATTVQFGGFQGNIAGSGVQEDGSPVGYPLQDNDHGLVVMRFDDMTNPAAPKPLATWVNYAEHGESLDEYDLISQDWIAPFYRYMSRATGAPLVFSQGSVGSAEGPYEHAYPPGEVPTISDGGDPVNAIYGHMGFAQAERGAHLLAEQAIEAWQAIGGSHNGIPVQVPVDSNPTVTMLTRWYAGPLSHPYPSVSNCRSDQTMGGDPGLPIVGLPDCERADSVGLTLPVTTALWGKLKTAGLPIPDNYDAPSMLALEENLRLKLQAVRIGSTLLASCACEPQADLIRNIESRTDNRHGNEYNGFDYANQADVNEAWPVGYDNGQPAAPVRACYAIDAATYSCPDPGDPLGQHRLTVTRAAFTHMEAEINNDAAGWNDPTYVDRANSEPADDAAIKGNFTHTELGAGAYANCPGYALSVGLGHTGDYNGYTVSYREYEARDSYRKALTSYGPHTADYMATDLVGMAAHLLCGTPVPSQPTDALATLDEQRQVSEAAVLGAISSHYYDGWAAQVPNSAGPAAIVKQPHDRHRFDSASVTWVGGDNWTDNPVVTVQRRVDGAWATYADQSGEIQTVLDSRPALSSEALQQRSGKQRWTWTANFEVYDAFPRADLAGGQVPDGRYRFVIAGHIHTGGDARPYRLKSDPFNVLPWNGITERKSKFSHGVLSYWFKPIRYPRLPKHTPSQVSFYADDRGGTGRPGHSLICKTCTFMPWATAGQIASVSLEVVDRGKVLRTIAAQPQPNGAWSAPVELTSKSQHIVLARGAVRDSYGETNNWREVWYSPKWPHRAYAHH
jgi:hypothetical protein